MSEKSGLNIVALSSCEVLTASGEKIKLQSVWQKQKTILVFLRHFACIACRAHAKQVWAEKDKYQQAGTQLVFIGNGQPSFIDKFKEDLGITEATIFTDPSLKTYYASGFKRGFKNVITPTSAINFVKLAAKGNKQTSYSKEAGTHWQLGGILALGTDGKVLYHYVSESLGDFPPEADLKV